jgi:hypothetical protein
MTWLATVPMETASGRAMLIHEVEEMRRIQLAVNLKSSELSLTPAYAENFRLISSIPDLISSLKNTIFIRKSFILQAESISHLN